MRAVAASCYLSRLSSVEEMYAIFLEAEVHSRAQLGQQASGQSNNLWQCRHTRGGGEGSGSIPPLQHAGAYAKGTTPKQSTVPVLGPAHLTTCCCGNAGIQGEVVRAVAASRYFSMLASAQGEVWSFGGGFNGELGFASSSWVTSAQKVEGELAKVSPFAYNSRHFCMTSQLLNGLSFPSSS